MTLKYVAAIWIAFTAIFGILFTQARSASINDTKTLLNDLLAEYDTDVRPVMDQFSAVNVSVTAYIKSIQEFDEVQEKFSFVGALFLGWEDANMKWNANEYGGVNTISVSYERVWVPELVLSSPSDDVSTLGQSWNKIRYYSNGFAIWVPVDLIESTCAVNVKNYPFDTQVCITSFSTIGYDTSEVLLRTAKPEFDLSIYQENSLWRIVKTKVSVQIVGGLSQLILSITLKRKPSFVIVNLVLPILFMSLLNVLVFLLVPESGERVSYCVTILLAIAVFMTIVSYLEARNQFP